MDAPRHGRRLRPGPSLVVLVVIPLVVIPLVVPAVVSTVVLVVIVLVVPAVVLHLSGRRKWFVLATRRHAEGGSKRDGGHDQASG
ncbi:MAG: hypothetical protein ACR2HA_01555 [Nocardioides sp.]